MKKTVFLFLLALSNNTFAQNQFLLDNKRHLSSNYRDDTPGRMAENVAKKLIDLNEIIFLPTLKGQASGQSTMIQPNDSIYRWTWDEITFGWKGFDKTIDMIYNNENSIESYTHCYWNSDPCIYDYKKIYSYDTVNNLICELRQLWHCTYHYWYNSERHNYIYNEHNNQVLAVWQVTNTNGDVWDNSIQLVYSYDFDNDQTSELHQTWSGTEWVNDYQVTRNYDNNNNVISVFNQSWNEGAWENDIRWDYVYDANNNQLSELNQVWMSGVWQDIIRNTSTYDSYNNRTDYLSQYWYSDTWKDVSRLTSEYDTNNNLISELGEDWIGNNWIKSIERSYTYDGNNFLRTRSNKNWNITGTTIQSGDSTYYYFHTITGNSSNKDQSGKVIVYPNPSSGSFNVLGGDDFHAVEVYDMLGKKVYSANKSNRQKTIGIDLSGYGKGIYFVKISNSTKRHIEKIVIN